MTRTTEHRNLSDDGRDLDYLRQCERAAALDALLNNPAELTASYAAQAGAGWDAI